MFNACPREFGLIDYASVITPLKPQCKKNRVLNFSVVLIAVIAPLVAGALLTGMNVNLAMGAFAVFLIIGAAVFTLYKPIRSIGKPDAWEKGLVEWPVRS